MPHPPATDEMLMGTFASVNAQLRLQLVHTVFSTQNVQQQQLARRFERLSLAAQPGIMRVPVRSRRLQGLQHDVGEEDTFRTDNWYRALVQKVTHWAEAANANPGQLMLCSDNDGAWWGPTRGLHTSSSLQPATLYHGRASPLRQ